MPSTAQRFNPPPIYRLWWEEVERCSGLRGNIDDVAFYTVPGANSIDVGSESANGVYHLASHRIVLAGDADRDGPVVRHEMLHALTRRLEHRYKYFRDKCGAVVSCQAECVHEAGEPPSIPASAIPILPDLLELSIRVRDMTPSRSRLDHRVPIVIRVRNPYAYPVIVQSSAGFDFMIGSAPHAPPDNWWFGHPIGLPPTSRFFKPHEVKWAVIDLRFSTFALSFQVDDASSSPELDGPFVRLHTVSGSYAGVWTAPTQFTSYP